MKILIAEDDLTSRSMLEAMLAKCGYDVVTASDGDQTWEALQHPCAPKLVVLDLIMPGMDGLDVLRNLRAVETATPAYVIILTQRVGKKNIVTGLDAGANDYIEKPFDADELRARIRVGEKVVELQSALAQRVKALEEALAHVKRLQGLLPICMHCHRIRSDEEIWEQIEDYVEQHTDVKFSHGLCPECRLAHYPDYPVRSRSRAK